MAPAANRDFAGYRIVRPLELGDRASVWEAENLETGGAVAIETLAGDAAQDPDVREWFAEAWESIAALEHPHIVSVEEVGEQEGVPFATRTGGGMTLARRLAVRGKPEPEAATALLAQIGGALEAAHNAGVVHGALGTGCVIVEERDPPPVARLSGFGRAEGNRREDIRDLGLILGSMVGDRSDTDRDREHPDAGPADEDGRAEVLREVVSRSRDDGYRTAADLVAAATAAIGGREDAASVWESADPEEREIRPARPRAGRRALVGLALVAAAVVAVVVWAGDGDDDSGAPPTDVAVEETTSITSSTTAPDQPAAGGTSEGSPIIVPGFPVGVSARDGVVYAVSRKDGELSGFDESSGERLVGPVDLGGGAEDVAIIDGVAWVTLPDSDEVARVDLAGAGPSVETIAVGGSPSSVIGAVGSAWVVDEGSAELSRIPLEGGPAEAVPLDGQQPRGIAYGFGSLWVSDAGGTVTRLDPEAPADGQSFPVGRDPRAVFVVDESVWTANAGDGTVSRLDPRSGEAQEVEIGGAPRELAADPGHLWISNGAGFVSSIDFVTGAVQQVDLSGAGGAPQGIAVDLQVWTATGAGNSLVAVAPGG